jgi:hypothetical protein
METILSQKAFSAPLRFQLLITSFVSQNRFELSWRGCGAHTFGLGSQHLAGRFSSEKGQPPGQLCRLMDGFNESMHGSLLTWKVDSFQKGLPSGLEMVTNKAVVTQLSFSLLLRRSHSIIFG